MTVKGLENNAYLINNPIIIDLIGNSNDVRHFDLAIRNITRNTFSSLTLDTPPGKSEMKYNISPVIKSLFSKPNNTTVSNINLFEIQSVARNNEGVVGSNVVVRKSFIRGGEDTDKTNLYMNNGDLCLPADKIPYWRGKQVDYSSVLYLPNGGAAIITRFELGIHGEMMKSRSCDGAYIRFLNSRGGYSYWYFEGKKKNKKTKTLGRIGDLYPRSLGSEFESEYELFSKVPRRYYPLMDDLIASPEIYIQQEDHWERLNSESNTTTFDNTSRSTDVKLKFKTFSNYNPVITW